MVAFKTTQWQFSDEVDARSIPVEEGLRNMFIQDANYKEDSGEYSVSMVDLGNNAEFKLRYWLYNVDPATNTRTSNSKARGTLISLGKALAGIEIGIPYPADIVGGVVSGDVRLGTSSRGTPFPKVYHFMPVDKYLADCGLIDQYYIGAENDLPTEDAQE